MTILIDADGCPVTEIAVRLCQKYALPCVIFSDTAHEFHSDYAKTLVFDKGADSVDYAIAKRLSPGDLVITQDYGLASLCLAKCARVLHQDGWEYTAWNIDGLLMQRYTSRKLRSAGIRTKGPNKRNAAQNAAFEQAIEKILYTAVHG